MNEDRPMPNGGLHYQPWCNLGACWISGRGVVLVMRSVNSRPVFFNVLVSISSAAVALLMGRPR